MTLYIILIFVALCAGMAISVHAFGTGGKRKRIFQDIYFSVYRTPTLFRSWKTRNAWTDMAIPAHKATKIRIM